MFFPTADAKRLRLHNLNPNPNPNPNTNSQALKLKQQPRNKSLHKTPSKVPLIERLPSLPKAQYRLSTSIDKQRDRERERDRDKQNYWQPKLLKMARSENLVLNFKPKKQKMSKILHNKILMEIMMKKIQPWDVSASPEPTNYCYGDVCRF